MLVRLRLLSNMGHLQNITCLMLPPPPPPPLLPPREALYDPFEMAISASGELQKIELELHAMR
jgi:hypothetical protein